jgi:hypothetical protein
MNLSTSCGLLVGWSYALLWGISLFQGLLIIALLRQLSNLNRLVSHRGTIGEQYLPVGTPAPPLKGVALPSGQTISDNPTQGRARAILFLSADCGSCRQLAASLRASDSRLSSVAIFCEGEERACRQMLSGFSQEVPLLQSRSGETSARYGISRFPTAVLVDEHNRIVAYVHPKDAAELHRAMLERSHRDWAGSRDMRQSSLTVS